jgi:hypothetical protein
VHIPHIFQCLARWYSFRLFTFQYFGRLRPSIATGSFALDLIPLPQPRIMVLAQVPRHAFVMFTNHHLQETEEKDVASKLTRLPDPAGRQSL